MDLLRPAELGKALLHEAGMLLSGLLCALAAKFRPHLKLSKGSSVSSDETTATILQQIIFQT